MRGIAGQVDLHQTGRGGGRRLGDQHAGERVAAHGRVGRRRHRRAQLGHLGAASAIASGTRLACSSAASRRCARSGSPRGSRRASSTGA